MDWSLSTWLDHEPSVSAVLRSLAQQDPPVQTPGDAAVEADLGTELEDVIVLRRRGATNVQPEFELSPGVIDAFGASDIGEVLNRIREIYPNEPAPVILINGRPSADPGVYLEFPPDALERVEVLPQSASTIFGGHPATRVINLVLQPSFDSREGAFEVGRPWEPGTSSVALDLRTSAIRGGDTSHAGIRGSRDTALTGSDRRGFLERRPDAGWLTLRPEERALSANASASWALGSWSSSLRANASTRTRQSRASPGTIWGSDHRRQEDVEWNAGLNGVAANWSLQFALNGRLRTLRQTGAANSRGSAKALAAGAVARRTILAQSARPISLNLSAEASETWSDSSTDSVILRRRSGAGSVRLAASLPITSSTFHGQKASTLGDASATVGVQQSWTETGEQTGFNASLTWSPVPLFRLNTTWSREGIQPTDQQRFDPRILGEPRTVYDFRRGEAVEITPIRGGNPALAPGVVELLAISASAGPFSSWQISGSLDFQRTRTKNGVAAFTAPTPLFEDAFPDRFIRDQTGRLIAFDERPFNIDHELSEVLNNGLAFTIPLADQGPAAPMSPDLLRVTLTHTWRLTNRSVIDGDLPLMDRLRGDQGGLSRHEATIRVDARFGNWRANVWGHWRDRVRIRAGEIDTANDIHVLPIATANLALTYSFSQALPGGNGGSENSRRGPGVEITLSVENVFDDRLRARFSNGRPVPGYGRDDQDPLGRMVRLKASRRF